MSLSINFWVFGGISGIDYYRIDPAIGTSHSLMVCLLWNQWPSVLDYEAYREMSVSDHCELIDPTPSLRRKDLYSAILQENLLYTKIQNCCVGHDTFDHRLGHSSLRGEHIHSVPTEES